MKIAQINTTCGAGSTGKICVAISDLLTKRNIENCILYTFGSSDHPAGKKYMSDWEVRVQALMSRTFGNYGFQSKFATKRLIEELDKFAPDVILLHNLHTHNVHLELLFNYLKTNKIRVFWTFHDCWAFTGYCPYYDMVKCYRWHTGCFDCPQWSKYSWFLDRSRELYDKKKQLFNGLDITIITPSYWLANQVEQSFLKNCLVKVIHNGIDLSIFCPRDTEFRKVYNIENKYIVLGVAFGWGSRKGLDVFIRLAQKLNPEIFQIVLVGTDRNIDKVLPNNIISIHRTEDQTKLAEIYSAADVFVNPTREENFPTVNIESIACGTPVLTYNTGGSAEMLNENTGIIVDTNDEDALFEAILKIERERLFSSEVCRNKSLEYCYKKTYSKYVQLISDCLRSN